MVSPYLFWTTFGWARSPPSAPSCGLRAGGGALVPRPPHELRALVAATPGAMLREGYLSDETFDVWLVAADLVVLPYRHIWSSG